MADIVEVARQHAGTIRFVVPSVVYGQVARKVQGAAFAAELEMIA